jgi:pimeloyl-ACP methyl ester carboxylesterase
MRSIFVAIPCSLLLLAACATFNSPEGQATKPAHGAEGSFDSNGVSIHYVDEGHGTPLVLVHGLTNSIQTWRDTGVFEDLARDHRVVALDMRGHGKSGKPHDPAAYGPEMYLDVIRLMDHLGIKQAHIVGFSLGAYFTSSLLAANPDRFTSATLIAGGAITRYTDKLEARDETEAKEIERDCISRSFILRLSPPTAKPTEEELRKRSEDCMANPDFDRFAMAALFRGKKLQVVSADEVAKTRVPTLAIVGTLDPLRAAVQDLQKLRPDMKIVYIEGAVHSPLPPNAVLRQPETLKALRESFASN